MTSIPRHRNPRRARLFALASLGFALAAALPASAQEPKKNVIKIEEMSFVGRIQKPQAFYILPRTNLNYQELDRNDSFLPKIQQSLERAPF